MPCFFKNYDYLAFSWWDIGFTGTGFSDRLLEEGFFLGPKPKLLSLKRPAGRFDLGDTFSVWDCNVLTFHRLPWEESVRSYTSYVVVQCMMSLSTQPFPSSPHNLHPVLTLIVSAGSQVSFR